VSIIQGLIPWEHRIHHDLVLRGYHTAPTGKPLIHFIHGNGFCGLTFEHLLVHLQDEYDLFISDGQGHGDSDAGGAYPGWNQSAKYFTQVWQQFSPLWRDVPRIALGHSYGAIMSTLIMSKQPELFDIGVFMDPVYAPPRMAGTMSVLSALGLLKNTPLARQANIRTQSWPDPKTVWEYFHQRGTFKGWRDECLQSYLDHALLSGSDGVSNLKCPPRIEAAIFSTYANKLWPAIKRIQKPITMLYGDKTYRFVRQSIPTIRKSNPHYDFIEMPGGHCFMQENPGSTAHEIKQKLRFQLSTLERNKCLA
jgi:pimeloyl-ACP methyl ester carboxylesterase